MMDHSGCWEQVLVAELEVIGNNGDAMGTAIGVGKSGAISVDGWVRIAGYI